MLVVELFYGGAVPLAEVFCGVFAGYEASRAGRCQLGIWRFVMAGLDPAIHVLFASGNKTVLGG
jgi:hypothetical protein